jgi:DNA-binding HxlR family transcriptional regulator
MSMIYTMTRTPDLLPGTPDLLILRTLQKDAPHGWAVSERIQQISQDVLQINQGSLYPALHRLEHQGWIEGRVEDLGAGPPRQVLPLHRVRSPSTRGRSAGMVAHGKRDRPRMKLA